jgi:Flp pilus assembly pilin Flp
MNTTHDQELQEQGASMVEYALLIVMIALFAFLAVRFAGNSLSTTYSNIAVEVSNAGTSN